MNAETQKSIDIVVGVKDATAAGVSDIERSMDKFQKKMSEDRLKDLKGMFGEDSRFGLLAKTAMGGGAVAGLSFVGNRLEQLGEQSLKLQEQLAKGELSTEKMVNEFARGVPIVGSFFAAGQDFAKLITGVVYQEQRENELLEATNGLWETRRKITADNLELMERIHAKMREMQSMRAILGMPEGDRDRARADKSAEDRLAGLLKDLDASHAKNAAALNAEATKLWEAGSAKDMPSAQTFASEALGGLLSGAGIGQKKAGNNIKAQQREALDQIAVVTKLMEEENKRYAEQRRAVIAEAAKLTIAENSEASDKEIKALLDKRQQAHDAEMEQEAKFNEEMNRQRQRQAQESASFEQTLIRNRIELLMGSGDKLKEQEAERMEIAERYNQKRAELSRILEFEGASESQKYLASEQITDLYGAEQRDLARVGKNGRRLGLAGTAENDSGNASLMGYAAAGRERALLTSDPEYQERMRAAERDKKRNTLLEQANSKSDRIIDLLSADPLDKLN